MATARTVMTFHSKAVADGTLLVATAEGVEALGQPFQFDLDLVSDDPQVDLAKVLRGECHVALSRSTMLADGRVVEFAYDYHGMLSSLRQTGRAGLQRFRYRATLRSHLWQLARSRRSRIFTDKTVPDLLRAVLDEAGIAFTMKLLDERSYPIQQYAVQYEETDLDFITRWMEQIGITHYYDAKGDRGTLVITDHAGGYAPLGASKRVEYSDQGSHAWGGGEQPRIARLEVEDTPVPRRVLLKEYNCEAPANELLYEAEVDPKGVGTWYEYNSNFRTESEGRFLATVRRDYWRGRARRLYGETDHRGFQCGRVFTPSKHFNSTLNDRDLVLIEVRHRIDQANDAGHAIDGSYTCTFTAMPGELPYRPERLTEWPSIHGVVHARVAGGALGFAELDEMGRYKVDVDYDLNDHTIGKVRMAQPSVGEDAGMHFPLRKHTEVLLGHIDGDPDKPVILGAVHDGEKTNLLDKSLDPLGTKSRIKSQGGNIIEMDDDPNHGHMVMANGNYNTIQSFGRPSYRAANASGDAGASVNPARPAAAMTFEQFMAATGGPQGAQPPPGFAGAPASAAAPAAAGAATADPRLAAVAAWLDAASSSHSKDKAGPEGAAASGETLPPITVTPLRGTPPMEVTFTVNTPNAAKEYRWTYQEQGASETQIAIWQPEADDATTYTFEIEQNVYTIRCYERDKGTTTWNQIGGNIGLRTDLLTSSTDPEVANFYKSVLGNYAAKPAADGNPARAEKTISWDAGYYKIASWSSTAKNFTKEKILADFEDLYKVVTITQGTHYGADDGKVPTSFMGSDPIVTKGALSISDPPGRGQARTPELAFANFTGSQGGEQVLTFGDSLEVVYGDTWSRQYGHSYSWQSGDAHDYHPNGNSYTYFSGDSVTWMQGVNREWEYATTKKSYSYVENESSYSKVKTKSTSVSEVEASDSTETVFGLAKSVSNVVHKVAFEDFGTSATLQVGGPQGELTLNGPKLTIEGGISATFTLAAAFELTTGYKCEVNLAAKHEFNPVDSLELKTASQKASALADEATALQKTKTALKIDSTEASIVSLQAAIKKNELELEKTGFRLSKANIALQEMQAIFL